ncbi:mitochondrial peptide methionine sulfoxide reductase-like isoform X3 [Rhineura floridana]|uniref:mitochondrial peptide methionine sulfoxide reductase-like isoform X3 n=1 Tax=Rhineura floridana TaxID=261503 RepID=UPI002AC7F301|nr:mitochondrial peptide methionine sulfoxide reductase-like isoform X3 [Rhineura floridana]
MPGKVRLPPWEEALPGRAEAIIVTASHAVNKNPMYPPFPEGMQMAIFGMGCFWGAERMFWKLPGVFSTQVGFSGGFTPNPTYKEVRSGMTGHAEVVRVVFDPQTISYEDLLKFFWENHDPTQAIENLPLEREHAGSTSKKGPKEPKPCTEQYEDVGTQYRSAIYVIGADHLESALRSKATYEQTPSRQALLEFKDILNTTLWRLPDWITAMCSTWGCP